MITQTFQPATDLRATVSLDLDVNMQELHLEMPCPSCNDRNKDCPACKGKGVVPTANGARLIAFLKRHLT